MTRAPRTLPDDETMARERRVLRLQRLIQEIVAEALLREVQDPRLEMVTVTHVRLTADLSEATVHWSCLAREKGREVAAAALAGALPVLQRAVADALSIRTTPRLRLAFDPTLETAQRLETIFHHLAEERGETEGDPPGTSAEPVPGADEAPDGA